MGEQDPVGSQLQVHMLQLSQRVPAELCLLCRSTDVPIDPDTGEPVDVDTPNEVISTSCYVATCVSSVSCSAADMLS